jgi:NitT/TauT family transport system substrate-binding protein
MKCSVSILNHVARFVFSIAVLGLLAAPGNAQAPVIIKIAAVPIESAAEVLYALDMGFFAKVGLDARIEPLGSGAATSAVASNTFDIGYATVDTLATAHQKGLPFVVIAPATMYVSPATQHIGGLVLPANSPILQARDLNGKTVATVLNSLAEYAPRVWIDQNGGDSTTVKFIDMPFTAMVGAIEGGRVDAAWLTEPYLGLAAKSGHVLTYGFDGIAKQFLIGAWFTTSQWAHDHPDLVTRFGAAIHESAVWANKNPQKSADILAKYAKIDPALIANMARARYAERLEPSSMQPSINVAAKYASFSAFPAKDLMYAPSR